MNLGRFLTAAAMIGLTTISARAAETLIDNPALYTGPALDLSAYQTGSYNFTFGPVPVGPGISFTASPGGSCGYAPGGNSGMGSVVGQGGYGLGANGSFGGSAVYIGVDSGGGFDTLTFSNPVSAFGGFWNYAPGYGCDATITTFNGTTELGSFDLTTLDPISTPGGFDQFEFRAVEDTSSDITSVEFGGNYLLLAATINGAPAPTPTSVPEPGSLMLLLAGIAELYLCRRKTA
jgi:hypothetical protein